MLTSLPAALIISELFPLLPVRSLAKLAIMGEEWSDLVAEYWANSAAWERRLRELHKLTMSALDEGGVHFGSGAYDLQWLAALPRISPFDSRAHLSARFRLDSRMGLHIIRDDFTQTPFLTREEPLRTRAVTWASRELQFNLETVVTRLRSLLLLAACVRRAPTAIVKLAASVNEYDLPLAIPDLEGHYCIFGLAAATSLQRAQWNPRLALDLHNATMLEGAHASPHQAVTGLLELLRFQDPGLQEHTVELAMEQPSVYGEPEDVLYHWICIGEEGLQEDTAGELGAMAAAHHLRTPNLVKILKRIGSEEADIERERDMHDHYYGVHGRQDVAIGCTMACLGAWAQAVGFPLTFSAAARQEVSATR